MVSRTRTRIAAALAAILLSTVAANHYLNWGWFGERGQLVLSVTMVLSFIFLGWLLGRDW